MRGVLADLALESEAATALMLRWRAPFDERAGTRERRLRRLATAVGKYWVCKRAPQLVGEAMECLGGNGYVEEAACRGSTARRRSTRSGRARAT
jgi:putative acyl-CoA dehydrogenase